MSTQSDSLSQEELLEVAELICQYHNEGSGSVLSRLQVVLDDSEKLMEDVPVYMVGNNMPGYMPDSAPYAVATAERAVECLIEDLATHAFDCEGTEEEQEALRAIRFVKTFDTNEMKSDVLVHVGNYVYWIHCLCIADLYVPGRRETTND